MVKVPLVGPVVILKTETGVAVDDVAERVIVTVFPETFTFALSGVAVTDIVIIYMNILILNVKLIYLYNY